MSAQVQIRDRTYTLATLVLLARGNPVRQVLLGYKKSGFGQGKFTGFGGKVEEGECVAEAAIREMEEETGVHLAPVDLKYAGRLAFYFPDKPSWSQLVYVYISWEWEGDPVELEQVTPAWFDVDQIPFERMWQDSVHWLPPILTGKQVEADFTFKNDNENIRNFQIEFLNSSD